MTRCKTIFGLCLILLCAAVTLPAMTIKIGSIAPDRSPWHRGLRELGLEWTRITDGLVQLRIYPGSIAGTEEDMIRKMRVGILGGAALTNQGIILIDHDVYVTNIPMMIDSEAELKYVFGKMRPSLEEAIEDKGFKVIIWTMAGWIHIFTEHPVIHPDDLKKHKVSFSTGRPQEEQAWKKMGFHMVPNELKDMLMGLQSGMVNAFYLPPLMAASWQYFPFAPNMCSLKIAPLLGGIVLTRQVWQRIPQKYHEPMLKAARELSDRLLKDINDLEKEAIETMKQNGLVINQVPEDVVKEWKAASDKGMDELIGKAFSREIYQELIGHLKEYRARHGSEDDR